MLTMLNASQLLLSVVFLSSAIGKLIHFTQFVGGLKEYQIIPASYAVLIGVFLIVAELLVGVCILFRPFLDLALVLAMLLCVVFVVSAGITVHKRRTILCNCFGILSSGLVGPGLIARNFLLISLIAIVSAFGRREIHDATVADVSSMLVTPSAEIIPVMGIVICFLFLIRIVELSTALVYRLSHR